jgi:hypothetical protein
MSSSFSCCEAEQAESCWARLSERELKIGEGRGKTDANNAEGRKRTEKKKEEGEGGLLSQSIERRVQI